MKLWSVVVVWSAFLLPSAAQASDPGPKPDPLISDGIEVGMCGWPTAVAVQGGGLCTGTLVAPNLVAYAAHCGAGGSKKVRFGETTFTGKSVTPEFCMTNPGYSYQGNDWAFCKLAEPIDLPTTPVVFGCETQILQPGAQIAIVGFGGNTDVGGAGTKRWGMTTLLGVNWAQNITQIGGNGQPSICPGDSGGPTLIQYPDGSWHSFGIASTYNGVCGSQGIHALLPGAVEWIEENSGVDITPCHDIDGTWNPTPLCQGFFTGDENGFGTWADWCEGTPGGGSSETCGDPFDAEPDEDPPLVAITAPGYGEEFAPFEAMTISVDASDVGWGVKTVGMRIQGEVQPITDEQPPYEFPNVSFPKGTWELIAVAEDWAGQISESEPVLIGVGGPVEEPEPEETDTGGEETDDTGESDVPDDTSSDTEGDPMGDGADDGCGCVSSPAAPSAWWLLGLGLFVPRRRRRFSRRPG